ETVGSGISILSRNLTGWGMGLIDFDNDGFKDVFLATSHFPGSEPHVHTDAAISNHIFRNTGTGRFEEASGLAGRDFQRPALYHGAAFADFDNDGRVDAVVTAVNSYTRLFRNTTALAGHWLGLRLIGTASNRSGLGALVSVKLPGGHQVNRATTAVGYASSSEPAVRFGLGNATAAAEVEIRWPSGQVQVLRSVTADQLLDVREPPVTAK
ncbi:MAG TPA: CRTAC1 family protein, partial [Bryobacteraceae bacterium]|nr:CRTAC1 family protein [Bryobacteraceae bacterium]